jgi:hypothetical protein
MGWVKRRERIRPTVGRWFAACILIGILGACGISPSATSTPSETLAPNASQAASPAGSAAASPTRAPSGLTGLAVLQVDAVRLRDGPGLDQPVRTIAPGGGPDLPAGKPVLLKVGSLVWVTDQRAVQGTTWFRVIGIFAGGMQSGWVSGGPDSSPWLKPFDRTTCPPSPVAAFDQLSLEPMRALACLNSQPVTLVAYWPTPAQQSMTSEIPCTAAGPRWLLCYEWFNRKGDGTRAFAVYGTSDLAIPHRGQWVTLRAHYDDPRSAACPSDLGRDAAKADEAVLWCRTRLVADSAEPTTRP